MVYLSSPAHNLFILKPRGDCWLWDWNLISLHGLSDLLTFAACIIVFLVAAYIYRNGKLRRSTIAFPGLWTAGAGFVFFCGLVRLGNFLEIWYGGSLYWWTGANKLIMAGIAVWFAVQLWRLRDEIALVGRVLFEAHRQGSTDKE